MDPLWRPRNEKAAETLAPEASESLQGATPPSVIQDLLVRRGFGDANSFQKLLYPKLSDMKDPLLMAGMATAVERLVTAFRQNEKICIYADFDLDGTSGLALLYTGLKQLGFKEVLRYQPKRLSEGYGFHAAAVEELKEQGVSLIITVDVGITALKTCERARELGVDIILTDHHLPGDSLPVTYALVNPNQPADTSGLGYLSGAGVAFYLLRALKKAFFDASDLPHQDLDLKILLDYFTIATLTDMVPLVDDNRVLVKHGLIVLQETKRAGLRALLDALDLSGRPLSSQDVAIRFAPKLNALSRMETGLMPIDIFLCDDPVEARRLIKDVLKNNSTRIELQSSAEQEAVERLKDWPHEEFVFVSSATFHRGIVGLIATKLAQNFRRPAFVGSADSAEGTIVGSARVPPGSEVCLVEAMGSAREALNRFGGHSAAAGFELHSTKIELFLQGLSTHFKKMKEAPKPPELVYDLELNLEEISPALMKWYDFVGPFGAGFDVPVFKFSGVTLLSKRELKGGHLKLKLGSTQSSGSFEALLFSPSERQIQILESGGALFDILGELQWNYFNGSQTVQLLVKDLKVRTWQ